MIIQEIIKQLSTKLLYWLRLEPQKKQYKPLSNQ